MGDNVEADIQGKIWVVTESLIPRAKELTSKAKQLPEDSKKNIPAFSGDWSEEGINKFLEECTYSIREPLRHKNRSLLETIGIHIKGVSEEILDDSTSIEEIVCLFNTIKEFNIDLSTILINEMILIGWLKEGTSETKQNLQEILDAKTGFELIFKSNVGENIINELIERSIKDRNFIISAEAILSKIKSVMDYGVVVDYEGNFDIFQSNLKTVSDNFEELQNRYKISRADLNTMVNGKQIRAVDELLKNKILKYSENEKGLLNEWKTYFYILKSVGSEVHDTPHGLQELEDGVKKLKSECMRTLGEEGLSILSFLKGEGDFPDKISNADIKKVLELLRPTFTKFLKEES